MATQHKPMALIGFMGAGKSSLAQALAAYWQCPWHDMDAWIERLAGQSIRQLVQQEGEVGLRSYEYVALLHLHREMAQVAAQGPYVLATGGGTFMHPACRAHLLAHYHVIWLDCPWPVLEQRLSTGRAHRPLLQGGLGDGWITQARQLYGQRLPVYQCAPLHWSVDDSLSPPQWCEQLPQESWTVGQTPHLQPPSYGLSASHSLDVASRQGSYTIQWVADPHHAARLLSTWHPQGPLVLFSDPTVMALHGEILCRLLQGQQRPILHYMLPEGEQAKQLSVVEEIYRWLAEHQLGTDVALLALGGGVVSDVVGFVAATWLRGVACYFLPTTTLAVVDASVGGKNGLNMPHGKNQVGTIAPPKGIICALSWLITQSPFQHQAGLVEAVKMALTLDGALFADLQRHITPLLAFDPQLTPRLLLKAVAAKAMIVKQDELDQGVRAVLNFGHTVGHALEVASCFRLHHGQAVALGMLAEMEMAIALGLTDEQAKRAYVSIMEQMGMPLDWRKQDVALEAMGHDKKRRGSCVNIPLCPKIGQYAFSQVPLTTMQSFLSGQGAVS